MWEFTAIYHTPTQVFSEQKHDFEDCRVEVFTGARELKVPDLGKIIVAQRRGNRKEDLRKAFSVVEVGQNDETYFSITVLSDFYDGPDMDHVINRVQMIKAFFSIRVHPCLFYNEVFKGTIFNPHKLKAEFFSKSVQPVEINWFHQTQYILGKEDKVKNSENYGNVLLFSKFFMKSIECDSQEEVILNLWTALEIFPMLGTRKVKVLTDYLCGALNKSKKEIENILNPGDLYGMRGEIVHKGKLISERYFGEDRSRKIYYLKFVAQSVFCNELGISSSRLDQERFQIFGGELFPQF